MYQDRYQLSLKGNLLPGANQAKAIVGLAKLFNLANDKALSLIDGKTRAVKKTTDVKLIQALERKLKQIGVNCSVDVIFDETCFSNAVVHTHNKSIKPPIADLSSQKSTTAPIRAGIYRYRSSIFKPTFYAAIISEPIVATDGQAMFNIESYKYRFGYTFLLCLAAIIALPISYYLAHLLTSAIMLPWLTIFVGLALFAGIGFGSAFILQTKSEIQLVEATNTNLVFSLLQKSHFFSQQRRYDIFDANGDWLAEILCDQLQNTYVCLDVNDTIILQGIENSNAKKDDSGLANKLGIYLRILPFVHELSSRNKHAKIQYQILNQNSVPVARMNVAQELELNLSKDTDSNALVFAMSLALAGA